MQEISFTSVSDELSPFLPGRREVGDLRERQMNEP